MANNPYAGLDPEFASKVIALIHASAGRVRLVSGYRSPERQKQLWDAAVKKYGSAKAARKWVAPPGKSNHNRGMAVDLGGDLELAARLAPKFGLHRPMKHEPWHFEPSSSRGKKGPTKAGHTHDHEAEVEPELPEQPAEPVRTTDQIVVDQMAAFMGFVSGGVDLPEAPEPPEVTV